MTNTAKLEVALELDRNEYFPGELIKLTITVRNPTAQSMEIRKPFASGTGTVQLLVKDGVLARAYGLEYGPVSPGPDGVNLATSLEELLPATVKIGAGETITRTFRSYERILGETPGAPILGSHRRAGEYRIVYWGAAVDFRVVRPTFEGMSKIDLPDWEVAPATNGEMAVRLPLKTYAFVLSAGGKHFVCVERVPFSQEISTPRTEADGHVSESSLFFGRYSRVAESDEPIISLRGQADAAGGINLTWGNDAGKSLHLDRNEWEIAGLRSGQ